jgi:ParB-like nuclease domain
MAMNAGKSLPPISLVRTGDGYAVRDGHHRVSVAKWTGAATISAVVA